MKEKVQRDWNSMTFNICPNILHADADADPNAEADAGDIAIAPLHWSAGVLKSTTAPT